MSEAASTGITWLNAGDPPESFPPVDSACTEPDGLLAAGGDLGTDRLLYAYRNGIFPWYEDGQPILWWSPDPRCVLRPGEYHVARRLRRSLQRSALATTFNTAFADVIDACAGQRLGQNGTWITGEMTNAYRNLHAAGWAHSVEVWNGDTLVGGMYGLAIGRVFFGESMFSRETNASKVAMLALTRHLLARDFVLLDCQVVSPHLFTLGAVEMSRRDFQELLAGACDPAAASCDWPTEHVPVADWMAGGAAPAALQ